MQNYLIKSILTLIFISSSACGQAISKTETTEGELLTDEGALGLTIELTSPAFSNEGAIPIKYSCDGEDISPALTWNDPPAGTQSLALIMDDPDAPRGTWVHWVLFNIPAESRSLGEVIINDAQLADGSRHGENSWGRLGYGGPCPPSGTHRYFFKLIALDTTLDLEAGADNEQLIQAAEGHVLAQGVLMGTFSR